MTIISSNIEILPPIKTKDYSGPDRRYESEDYDDPNERKVKLEIRDKNDFKNEPIRNLLILDNIDILEENQTDARDCLSDVISRSLIYKEPNQDMPGMVFNLMA